MTPCSFDESNEVLGRPEGMEADECDPLCVWRGPFLVGERAGPAVASCWKLNEVELVEVFRTKRVWLVVLGETMQPCFVLGEKPYLPKQEEDDA